MSSQNRPKRKSKGSKGYSVARKSGLRNSPNNQPQSAGSFALPNSNCTPHRESIDDHPDRDPICTPDNDYIDDPPDCDPICTPHPVHEVTPSLGFHTLDDSCWLLTHPKTLIQ